MGSSFERYFTFYIYMVFERRVSLLKGIWKRQYGTELPLLPGNTADITAHSDIPLDVLAQELDDKIHKKL